MREHEILKSMSGKHLKREPVPSLVDPDSSTEDCMDAQIFVKRTDVTLYRGDARNVVAHLANASVDCIVTSPPYYGQRDYGVEGQLGLEEHPQQYIDKLVATFHEAKRVLKPTGSLWVNLGDTYWSGKGKPKGEDKKQKYRRFPRPQDNTGPRPWCVPKQLLLIPHRFAIGMQEDGWIVRNDNVWYKPSPTPDPVGDRCALAHEYVFHFVLKRRYYFNFDAVAVPSNGKRVQNHLPPCGRWQTGLPQRHTEPCSPKNLSAFQC